MIEVKPKRHIICCSDCGREVIFEARVDEVMRGGNRGYICSCCAKMRLDAELAQPLEMTVQPWPA